MINRIYILIGCLAVSCSVFFCDKEDNLRTIITKVDMEEMAHRHLPDFYLLLEGSIDSVTTEYVFVRESDSAEVSIRIGLYQSEENAENAAIKYLSLVSTVMEEGPHQGVSIGDKFWWLAPLDPNILTNIVVIRKNALIIFNCSYNYEELKKLAKLMDDDIANEESYIIFQN